MGREVSSRSGSIIECPQDVKGVKQSHKPAGSLPDVKLNPYLYDTLSHSDIPKEDLGGISISSLRDVTSFSRRTGDVTYDEQEEDASGTQQHLHKLNPYQCDSMSSCRTGLEESLLDTRTDSFSASGWGSMETISSASREDDPTKIPPPNSKPNTQSLVFEPSEERGVSGKEFEEIIVKNYNNQVPSEIREVVETTVAQVPKGNNLLERQMDALSKKIDAVLQEQVRNQTQNYEYIHAMILRFCMIHMRQTVKDKQEYIDKIGDEIKIEAGVIRGTYNTWPVVVVTLIASGVSIAGGVGGFAPLIRPGNAAAMAFANHSQQLSSMSTGISNGSQLLGNRSQAEREWRQTFQQRQKEKESEQISGKAGNKETQKGLLAALQDFWRNIRDTISAVLRS